MDKFIQPICVYTYYVYIERGTCMQIVLSDCTLSSTILGDIIEHRIPYPSIPKGDQLGVPPSIS